MKIVKDLNFLLKKLLARLAICVGTPPNYSSIFGDTAIVEIWDVISSIGKLEFRIRDNTANVLKQHWKRCVGITESYCQLYRIIFSISLENAALMMYYFENKMCKI